MGTKSKMLTAPPSPAAIASWQESLRGAMFNAITQEDVETIVKSLVEKAKAGDEKSLRFVFDYILGGRQGPPQIRDSNVVIQSEVPARKATAGRPRSRDKIDAMRERASRGETLFHPSDAAMAGH